MKLIRLGRATVMCLSVAWLSFFSNFVIHDAHASGIGGYLTLGKGEVNFNENWDDSNIWDELKSSGDAEFYGFGFIFDTNVAKNRVFSYRLQVGFEKAEYDFDSVKNITTNTDLTPTLNKFKLDIDRLVFDNTFGFGIVREKNFRLWVGPQIRIGSMSGDGSMTDIYGTKQDLDLRGFIYGIAPVIGVNFNFNNNLTIGVDLGYRFNGFWGNLEKSSLGVFDEDYYYGSENTLFFNFSLIYRINDNF